MVHSDSLIKLKKNDQTISKNKGKHTKKDYHTDILIIGNDTQYEIASTSDWSKTLFVD